TVVSEKSKFLRRQTRILSESVMASARSVEKARKAGLPESVIRDVIQRVNRELKRHSKIVYSDMSIRHVADQIDTLYWNSAAPELEIQGDSALDTEADDGTLYEGDDLSLGRNIEKLPTSWDASEESPASDEDNAIDQDAYASALTRLQDLSTRRLTLQHKLTTYRTLLSLLEPYRNPQETVQPNLVTRDGPLATELGRTRKLAIRVAGRVGEKIKE
ncbi:hypothetical protein GQ43DRAFT_352033, partial [Delitschia confertaspora ATCC 74209]